MRRLQLPLLPVRRCFMTGQNKLRNNLHSLRYSSSSSSATCSPSKGAVAHQLPHMSPVLLFHSRVVVLSVGARTGEADRDTAFAKVIHQVPVEELAAIIGVEAQDGERQGRFDLSNTLRHCRL